MKCYIYVKKVHNNQIDDTRSLQEGTKVKKKKVLIVDDEENIVELIKFNLQKNGYETIEAYNGKEALNLVENEKPDLLILDWMLPEVDGLEVCKKVKNIDKTISVIMLTAKDEEIDKILGLEIGFQLENYQQESKQYLEEMM